MIGQSKTRPDSDNQEEGDQHDEGLMQRLIEGLHDEQPPEERQAHEDSQNDDHGSQKLVEADQREGQSHQDGRSEGH